ncbi:MAG TPA: hypothetical protein DCF68_22660 [Cyanothece sp. UBA12306]|nr:hypothetical protein [Cyanothece sp. UBA12306]
MLENIDKLPQISMVTSNFGDGQVFAEILKDWFEFIGGKPGEVVVVDCASSPDVQEIYWQLFKKGLIDKLQVIQENHEDNYEGKNSGYIKEYTSGSIASKPYLLFFHVDTLPYREGHHDWLKKAIDYLERDDVFAIGGSFNKPAKHHDAWPGWYFSHKCSLNFSLMKRSTFMKAVHEFAGDYILSGFKGDNPNELRGRQGRFLIEAAFEAYMSNHKLYTLCKIEEPTWTVFHTNLHEERLKKARDDYLQRIDIDRFMNAGLEEGPPIPGQGKYYGNFYGKPNLGLIKQVRISFGESWMGFYWRKVKQSLGLSNS